MNYTYRQGNSVFLVQVRDGNYAVCNCREYEERGWCNHATKATAAYAQDHPVKTEWKEFDHKEKAVKK